MTDYLSIFLKALAASIPLSIAVPWVIQKITEQLLSRNIEKFKSSLEKEAIEFQIKFARVDDERANVIKELHVRIVDTYDSFLSYISPVQFFGEASMNTKEKESVDAYNDLLKYFRQHSIFLSRELEIQIQNLLNQFGDCLTDYQGARMQRDLGEKVDSREWLKAWKMLTEQVSETTKQIKDQFRDLIGIQ